MEKKREEKPFSSAAGRRRRLACLSLLCALYLLPQTVFASDAGGQRDLTEAGESADPDDVSAKGSTGSGGRFFFRKQGCGQMVRTGRLWLPAVCPAVCPFLLRDRKHYFSDPSIIKLRMIRFIGYNEICAL